MELGGQDLTDPLRHLSGVSLLPRTFRDFKKNVSSSSKSDDLESIHEFMKSKDSRSPNRLSDQANMIADGLSELLDTNVSSLVAVEKPKDMICETDKGNPRGRRPALGLKRPHFTMKPRAGTPAALLESMESISDIIDRIEDPVECFMALERRENAVKELKKLMGCDPDPDLIPLGIRAEDRRRPSLLGKIAKYKHHTYGKVGVSQETSGQENFSLYRSPEKAAPINEVQEKEIISSISETEKRVNKVLDKLFSDKCKNLDANGTLTFLQEQLQIKSMDLDKFCLPDFPDVGKVDTKHVKEKSTKPPKVSSVVQNLLKSISDKSPQKDRPVPESPSSSLASPTPPKDPFASKYLLKRSTLKSGEKSHDKKESTTNAHVDDSNPAEIITCDSIDLSNKCYEMEDTDHVRRAANDTDILMEPNEMKDNVEDIPQDEVAQFQHDTNVTEGISDKTRKKDKPVPGSSNSTIASPTLPENPFASIFLLKRSSSKSKEKSHDELVSQDPFPSREFPETEHFDPMMIDSVNIESTMNEHVEVTPVDRSPVEIITCDSIHLSNKCIEMEDTDPCTEASSDNVIPPVEMQGNVGDVQQEALAQCQQGANVTKDTPMMDNFDQTEIQNDVQEIVEDQSHCDIPDANIEFPASRTSKRSKVQIGQSSTVALSIPATGKPSKSPVKKSGKEKKQQEPPLASQRNSKKPANGTRQNKKRCQRQSLADAGASWTSGVRRSSRIKMRPLEFWKGERFLYGRVHNSLTSVIGVKYMSPGKGDEATWKVKSFKDEYKELVDLAALH